MLLATFVTADKSSSRRGAKLSPSETNNALTPLRGELAFPWRGGGLRRPHFFLRRKKCGKESRLDLRSKGPLARGGQVRIWRCVLAGGVQRSSLSVKRTVPAFTGAEASATACPATVGVFASTGLGEFRCPGGEQVLRLRAQAAFFSCRKKAAKERHLRKGGFRISPFP